MNNLPAAIEISPVWLAVLLIACASGVTGAPASVSVASESAPTEQELIRALDETAIDDGRAGDVASTSSTVALETEPAIIIPEPDTTCDVQPGPFDRSQFRVPLPLTARWNPPGTKRVGLQAGHWLTEQTPQELRALGPGASGGGKAEWEVNLEIARRAGRILEAEGILVDILPTTVPVRYHAHAFVSVHADGDPAGRYSGFKIARPGFSSLPDVDDRLVNAIYATYEPATGLARDDEHVSLRMRYYYAFNSRRYCHAVARGVPQAIVETGFLTHAGDRDILIYNPEAPARGIANGILAFLREE
jgi:N-acetylmuramoyl-L-alanine amidase